MNFCLYTRPEEEVHVFVSFITVTCKCEVRKTSVNIDFKVILNKILKASLTHG
jgi:hypothetical protein